jgi:hypothetical protein
MCANPRRVEGYYVQWQLFVIVAPRVYGAPIDGWKGDAMTTNGKRGFEQRVSTARNAPALVRSPGVPFAVAGLMSFLSVGQLLNQTLSVF